MQSCKIYVGLVLCFKILPRLESPVDFRCRFWQYGSNVSVSYLASSVVQPFPLEPWLWRFDTSLWASVLCVFGSWSCLSAMDRARCCSSFLIVQVRSYLAWLQLSTGAGADVHLSALSLQSASPSLSIVGKMNTSSHLSSTHFDDKLEWIMSSPCLW